MITVQHGSGTAGGAYMPGLSDVVIMVRKRSRAFLAGPPLLMAATGEVATEEELGGAEMHTAVSGLGEYLAEDDRHALGIAREVVAKLSMGIRVQLPPEASDQARMPTFDAEELLGLMPANLREPVDMREIIARIVDGSDLLEFKPLYGAATVCVQAAHRRPRGGHHHQQRADRRAPAPTRPRTSSSGCASSATPSSICRTPPATWSARTASRAA